MASSSLAFGAEPSDSVPCGPKSVDAAEADSLECSAGAVVARMPSSMPTRGFFVGVPFAIPTGNCALTCSCAASAVHCPADAPLGGFGKKSWVDGGGAAGSMVAGGKYGRSAQFCVVERIGRGGGTITAGARASCSRRFASPSSAAAR
eukprot:scaffold125759_cov29-Tisochrysis_lutea.AAC.4